MIISVAVSGFISWALAAGVFILARGKVVGLIPLALAAGVFIAFMVLVSGFIPLALAAGVFIAVMVSVSVLTKQICLSQSNGATERVRSIQNGCPSSPLERSIP